MDQFGFGYDLECSLGPGSLVGNRVKNKGGQKTKNQPAKQAGQARNEGNMLVKSVKSQSMSFACLF